MSQTLHTAGKEETDSQLPKMILKSSGTSEQFDIRKLELAIVQSLSDCKDSENLRNVLIKTVFEGIRDKITTSTHYINDIIETYLLRNKHYDVLQKYIRNRFEKNKVYSDKVNLLGSRLVTSHHFDKKELTDFSVNQIQIAANRYLQKDMETGDIVESMTAWFERVASHVVLGSVVYDPSLYTKEGGHVTVYNPDQSHRAAFYFNLSTSQAEVLERIYYKLYKEGKMKYGLTEFLERVDHLYHEEKYQSLKRKYFQYMYQGIFEPNTPTLMNAGTRVGGLSACFTLGVDDNMKSIMKVDTDSALIFKMAGGLGVNVSHIRPAGANIDNTYHAATGPISLVLELINKITDVVKSGGKRRGANMGLMEYWHPDINTFIDYKLQVMPEINQELVAIVKLLDLSDAKKKEYIQILTPPGNLLNFNISVMFDDEFWKFYNDNASYPLKFGDKVYGFNSAREFIDKIATSAWSSAEPGVTFKDNANKANPLRTLKGDIDICNPCAEQFMYSGESCTLGSINLAKLVREDGIFDWDQYTVIINHTVRFLNDVLEINQYPTEHITEESDKSKRIGLGIMGLADMFFLLKIPYNSEEGFQMMDELARTLYAESVLASIEIAHERGSCYWYDELIKSGMKPNEILKRNFGDFDDFFDIDSHYSMKPNKDHKRMLQETGIRNMWTTTIAPTGTISMIADTSSALEPIFSLVFSKITNAGKYYYVSEPFKQALLDAGIYSQSLIDKVERNYGSCQGIDEIPIEMQKVFLTAMDLHWIDHVVAQSVWQNWIDNSISKTINMPFNVTVEDVKNAYILAHELGLKGIALFRDGSRNEQVLHVGSNVQSNKNEQNVQKDTPGTVLTPTKNQVERNVTPSRYGMNYIRERIPEQLMTQLTIHAGKVSQYLEKGDKCPNCSEMTLIFEAGCSSCKKCGFATCSVA